MMLKRVVAAGGGIAALVVVTLLATTGAAPAKSVVTVYKSATCGCCHEWIAHLEKAGYEVDARDMADMGAVKERFGVPMRLGSCHTAIVDGYVIEGHVPAADIDRLLSERPEVAGLTVPGMIVGSPGMEVAGQPAQPYDVLTFDRAGNTGVYASHR